MSAKANLTTIFSFEIKRAGSGEQKHKLRRLKMKLNQYNLSAQIYTQLHDCHRSANLQLL